MDGELQSGQVFESLCPDSHLYRLPVNQSHDGRAKLGELF